LPNVTGAGEWLVNWQIRSARGRSAALDVISLNVRAYDYEQEI